MANIIIVSTSYWDSPLRFRRHFFAELAATDGHNVVYVNPVFTVLSFIQDEDSRKCFLDFFKGPKQINPNLKILTLPPLLPFQQKFSWIKNVNLWLSGFLIKNIRRREFGRADFVEIVYLPEDIFRISRDKKSFLVYDCVDDHIEYPWNKNKRNRLIEYEKRLAGEARLLSISSLYLLEKKKHLNAETLLVPNGVNFRLFNEVLHKDTKRPEEISPGTPNVLYVGAIHEWFDDELVLKIAEEHNDWNILLIGRTNKSPRSPLFHHERIKFLGARRQQDLPVYIKYCDVCIIPFQINDLVKSVNPLKLYEYLSVGRPVVSTPLPDVEKLAVKGSIHVGKDHNDFIRQLEYFIEGRQKVDQAAIERRIELAYKYSWRAIYDKLMARISILNNRQV